MNAKARSVDGSVAKKRHKRSVKSTGPDMAERRVFGKLVQDRRHAAGFTRLALAQRAQLSDATIKFLEHAYKPPSRKTLIRLFSVHELGLVAADDCPWLAKTRDSLALEVIRLEKWFRLSGCTQAPTDPIGCRTAIEVFAMLSQLVEKPEERFQLGARATLLWQLGMGPAPLLAGYDSADTMDQVLRLARIGGAAADPTDAGGPHAWFCGIEAALSWVRYTESPPPVGQGPRSFSVSA